MSLIVPLTYVCDKVHQFSILHNADYVKLIDKIIIRDNGLMYVIIWPLMLGRFLFECNYHYIYTLAFII